MRVARERYLTSGAVLLFALGVIKLSWLALARPLLAYANSYDFIRQSSCVGIWQWKEGIAKTAGNYQYPIGSLINDGEQLGELCLHSIDNLFPYLAGLLHQPNEVFAFAQVAVWKLIFWVVLSAAVLLHLPNPLRLGMALVFFLLAGDWVFVAYANTLYLEFSVIASCFICLAAGTQLLAGGQRPSRSLLFLCMAGLVWLGWSKLQYSFLASGLALIFAGALMGQWRQFKPAGVLLALAVLLPLSFWQINAGNTALMRTMSYANKTDTFLGAVLPAASDPAQALQVLGLPPQCEAAIGKSWYTPRVDDVHPCPQVEHVRRAALLRLFVLQPATFFAPLHKAIVETRPLYPPYLGVIEPDAGAAAEDKLSLAKALSASTWISALPLSLYIALTYAGLLGAGLASLLLGWECCRVRMTAEARSVAALFALGGVVSFYALISSVFGDGYIELQKHAVGFGVALMFQWVAFCWLIVRVFKQVVAPYLTRL